MVKDNIVITKENDGEAINFFEESSDGSDIEIARKNTRPPSRRREKRTKPPPKNDFTAKPNFAQPKPTNHQGSSPPQMGTLNDNMFEVFTNPDKTRVEESEDEYPTGPVNNEPNEQGHYGNHFENDLESEEGYEEYEEQPSAGFNTIEEEKQDLLYKFYRLTSKGIPVSRKFNMQSDVKEMRSEFNRIQRDNEVKSSIRFSRRMLMACVTGIEFLNKRYDPFDIKLEGWSESVMENVDDYDNVFERLHDKYASKVSMAPEIELLLSLAGSAFMFHLTNSMFNSLPNLKDIAKQNPDILKNMMQSMSSTMNTTTTTATPQEESNVNGTGEREMKPPAVDISNLFSMMQPMITPPPTTNYNVTPINNVNFPTHSRTTDIIPEVKKQTTIPPSILKKSDSISSISSLSINDMPVNEDKTKVISFSESNTLGGTKKKGRGRNKIVSNSENTMSI